MRRPYTDHGRAAIRLRACPGRELPVATYPYPTSASTIASSIRTGALPAYQPAGSFQARYEANADRTGWTVYGRYIGEAS